MGIRMDLEEIVSMAGATKVIPKRASGKRVHVATVYRWASVGLKGVRLETIQIGGHCYTSTEALHRFFKALTADRDGSGGHENRSEGVSGNLDRRLAGRRQHGRRS